MNGGTNIAQALGCAGQLLRSGSLDGDAARALVLLTDGRLEYSQRARSASALPRIGGRCTLLNGSLEQQGTAGYCVDNLRWEETDPLPLPKGDVLFGVLGLDKRGSLVWTMPCMKGCEGQAGTAAAAHGASSLACEQARYNEREHTLLGNPGPRLGVLSDAGTPMTATCRWRGGWRIELSCGAVFNDACVRARVV